MKWVDSEQRTANSEQPPTDSERVNKTEKWNRNKTTELLLQLQTWNNATAIAIFVDNLTIPWNSSLWNNNASTNQITEPKFLCKWNEKIFPKFTHLWTHFRISEMQPSWNLNYSRFYPFSCVFSLLSGDSLCMYTVHTIWL